MSRPHSAHGTGMAAPLDESLRKGGVLSAVPASP